MRIKILSAVICTIILSGCATGVKMPHDKDFKLPSKTEIVKSKLDDLKGTASLTHKKGYTPIIIEKPIVIPKNIREKQLNISFNKDAKMKDLPTILREFGIIAVVKNDVINDEGKIDSDVIKAFDNYKIKRDKEIESFMKENGVEIDKSKQVKLDVLKYDNRDREKYTYTSQFKYNLEDIKIGLPEYKGTLQEFLDMLALMHNVSFNWQYGNYMIIEKYGDYTITVPQEEELITEIKTSIESLGATKITGTLRGGSITYRATKYSHERITRYINRLSYNTPSIGLELAVISVKLNKSENKGIDWESLSVISGSAYTGQYISGASEITNNIRDGMDGSLSTYGLNSSTASVAYASSNLIVNAALNLLNTYGQSRTEQSIMLKTLAGKEATFDTTQEIPYKSGSTSSNVNSDGGVITTDTSTEKVEVGLKISMTPYYDADNELLTMDVTFDSSAVDGFVDMGDGAFEPSIQKQTFSNKVKLRNDEAIILGGVTFDSTSENITGMTIFDDDWNINGSKVEKNKTAMFIIIKPSVEIYGNFDKDKIIK